MSASMISSLASIKADFKVSNLLAALEKNLEAHKIDYAKAVKAWKQEVMGAIDDLHSMYVGRDVPLDLNVARNFGLTTPINCESGYKQLIEVFRNINSETINIEIEEANNILNDDWSWATAAKATNSYYSSRV